MKKSINLLSFLLSLQLFVSFAFAAEVGESKSETAKTSNAGSQVVIPKTNAEIRLWYNHQVVIIPTLNAEWINEGVNAEERAQRAYHIRHTARIHARLLMRDKDEVNDLRERDMKKYGNPDGPTFPYLIEKNCRKGLSGDSIFEEIVKSSSRTSAEFNKRFNIAQ